MMTNLIVYWPNQSAGRRQSLYESLRNQFGQHIFSIQVVNGHNPERSSHGGYSFTCNGGTHDEMREVGRFIYETIRTAPCPREKLPNVEYRYERNWFGAPAILANLPCINGLSAWVKVAELGVPDPQDEMFGGFDYEALGQFIVQSLNGN